MGGVFGQSRAAWLDQRLPDGPAALKLLRGDLQLKAAGRDVNENFIAVLHQGDGAASGRLRGDMPDAGAMRGAGEAPVGDQGAVLVHTPAHDEGGGGEHLPHAGPPLGALIPDDQDGALLNGPGSHRRVRIHHHFTRAAVQHKVVAVLHLLHQILHGHNRRNLQGAGQNGAVGGAAAKLGDDAGHVGRVDSRRHGWGQILGDNHAASGQSGDAGTKPSSGSSDIGQEKAKEAALKHAGVSESQVSGLRVQQDWDDGRLEYEVEFYAGNQEYDYEIDASSGKILSFDYDIDRYAADTVQQSNTDIGTEKAKSIALSHAGVKAADTLFLSAEQDYDDGMRVYDVEFFAGNKEYDYKVDAANGKVLSFDYDTERRTPATSSDYIGEAKAKQIVEKAAGTTGVYSEFKLELDDGRALYEGELRSGAMEYEFEIDAVTGAIVDWEADRD